MKKSLVAAFASVLCIAAVGCVEEDDSSVDPALIEAIERDSGFEVILVETSGLPKAQMGEHGEQIQLDNGGLSYAPRPSDEFVGGAGLMKDPNAGSNVSRGMYPLGDRKTPTFERSSADMIDMYELETQPLQMDELETSPLIPMHELETAIPMRELEFPTNSDSSSLPADPCDCAGEACRQDWVETNLGCDVCAVFVCEGNNTPHACNACP